MILRMILALMVAACAALAASPKPAFSPAAIYQRTTNHFATAHFLKPSEPKEPDITFKLAPLIIQEGIGDEPLRYAFGALSLSNGVPVLDTSKPTVYVHLDQVRLGSSQHARFTYLWCYSANTSVKNDILALQGVRITTDSAGSPVIWEILADHSGADLLFVADSVERAAEVRYKTQPGRQYAVEPGLRQAPRQVVARVIADGPVPMGPILYLERASQNVSALVCRCMPSQAKSLLTSSTYQLKPIQTDNVDVLLQMLRERLKLKTAFWPGGKDAVPLEKRLRLPTSF